MRDRVAFLALAAVCAAGVAAALVWRPGVEFVVIAAAFAVAGVLRMPSPVGGGASAAPAVAGAVALTTGGDLVLSLATMAVSLPVSWLGVRILHGRRVTDDRYPSEPVGIAVFAAGYALVRFLPAVEEIGSSQLGVFVLAAGFGFLAAAFTRALSSAQRRSIPRRLLLMRALDDWPLYALSFSAAALYAIAAPTMGVWSILLAGFPYAFGHLALDRLAATRTAYDQTIRAFGRVPEAGGYSAHGHADRSAELAIAVAAELGLPARSVRRVEFAALLHDIGRLALANPALAGGTYEPADVSTWSAAIISEARFLEPVSNLVRSQHRPYRLPGQVRDTDVPRSAQVLRVVSAFDESLAAGETTIEALEALHRGAAYDYDPEVVMALRRVLERRSAA